jgi:hypothetical protein
MKNQNPYSHAALPLMLLALALGMPNLLSAQQPGEPASPPVSQNPTVSAQAQTANPSTQNQPKTGVDGTQNQAAPDPSVPKNDRILWTLPNYLTVENASTQPPLSVGKKFKLAAEEDLDPVEFGFVALASGVNQATDANPTYGQGFKGYGKRFAQELADNTIENFTVEAFFPSVLHQDPRYYQMAKGGFLRRFGYSASRIVVTRSDSGKSEFNFSEIFGAAVSATAADAYHPGPRTLGTTFDVWATQVAWDAAGFEMKEFWPDVHRRLTRHKQASSALQ